MGTMIDEQSNYCCSCQFAHTGTCQPMWNPKKENTMTSVNAEDAYRRGYAAGMKALEQFMADKEATAKLKTTERATEKPRSQSVPRTIQGWGVDVDTCQHWFVSILNMYEYGNVPLLQCSKCGYRKADL
jgi:ribosomal protein L37E